MSFNLAFLQPRLFIGLNRSVKGNVQHLTDDELVYPSGSTITVHNVHVKKQKYIKLAEAGRNLTQIAISPNKKIIAAVETADKNNKLPFLTLWCPITFRKKRQITFPPDLEIVTTKIVAIDFTFDSKYILVVTNEPDWGLYCFRCDKGKLESQGRAVNPNSVGTVREIACNPNDSSQVAVVGESQLRILACTDFQWRQFAYTKVDQLLLTSCCWLTQDTLVVGSSMGNLLILENGELKYFLNANDLVEINLKSEEPPRLSEMTTTDTYTTLQENYEIRCLLNFQRGFAYAFLAGKVHVFEKITAQKYVKKTICVIPVESSSLLKQEELIKQITIHAMSISPDHERIIVTCGRQQLYTAKIKLGLELVETTFKEYGFSMHNGPIGDICVCRWKPWVLTAGATDRTLKLWNYETVEMVFHHKFEDDLNGIGMHPSGLAAVVGFTDKLRFMLIMVDEFASIWEFPIRTCKIVRFSSRGHMFAAANGNIIQIYCTVTFDMLFVLKGHNGVINGMSWCNTDKIMASCGSDGAVYEWLVEESSRRTEVVIKSNPFTGVQLTSDAKSCFAIGIDGRLRELLNNNVYRDLPLVDKSTGLDAIVLSHWDKMLFISANGVIYSVLLPLMQKLDYETFTMHSAKVQKMEISFDDRFLFSAAADGSLCFWKILNQDDKAIKFDVRIDASEQVFIAKQVYNDKNKMIEDLKMRIKEQQSEHAYQMRQIENTNKAEVDEIHSKYCTAIEDLKEKNEQMEADHILEIQNINIEISKLKVEHVQFVQKLEISYNEKLINEYEKYQRYEEKVQRMRNNYEKDLADLKEEKKKSEELISVDFLEQLKDKQVIIDEMVVNQDELIKNHEMIKQQIEDDADREIYDLKIEHEKAIKEEQEINVRLRGEASVIQKKLFTTQKDMDEMKHTVQSLEAEHVKLQGIIINLDKEIAELKKEIQERDLAIEDKEKRIFQLKAKNQELDKFKFLLDFKIKELKSQIEPRERTIQDQAQQISEMVNELENLQKVILTLNLHVNDLKEKLTAADHEMKIQLENNRKVQLELKTIRNDIHRASGYIHNIPMLIKTVKEMYHKYNADKDFMVSQAEDIEAKSEFLRQRHFLERTVSTLQKQAAKSTTMLSSDKIRLVEENAALLHESNNLRRKYKEHVKLNKKFQSMMGTSSKGGLLAKIVQQRVDLAVATREDIHNEYKNTVNEKEKFITALQEENVRLVSKLTDCKTEEITPQKDDSPDNL